MVDYLIIQEVVKLARNKNKLVCGWGINDVDYNVHRTEVINGKPKIVWTCPYYRKWKGIITRCFCPKYQARQPTYKGCTISDEWQRLSDFIKWVDNQPNRDWQNCEPDKDFLFVGNKHYSPETVVFVSGKVNGFITACVETKSKFMIGVCDSGKRCKSKPYMAQCRNPFTGKGKTLGYFSTEIEAHKAWQAYKHEMACLLADLQSDPRVSKALRQRYAPDKDWTRA